MKLTIVTLNCYGIPFSPNRKGRFNLIAQEIERLNPDVVMLQEVWFKRDRRILEKLLLPKGWVFLPKNFSHHGPGGLLLITRGLSLNDYQFFKFKDQGPIKIPSVIDRLAGKGFQFVSLQKGNGQFSLINSHLLCRYRGGIQITKSHFRQLKQLKEFVESLKGPVILGGDLNINSSSQKTTSFKNELKLNERLGKKEFTVDPKNLNRKRVGIMNLYYKYPYRCDYIFTDSAFYMAHEKVIFKNPLSLGRRIYHLSDHYGLLANVYLK